MSPGNIDLFATGTLVEVSSADGWFPGGWFVAKVLDPPPPSPTAPRKMIFLVEYQSLLYGSKLLRKRVDIKFMRPLPPPPPNDDEQEQQRFQVNDVVDAYRNDGWWVGVVSKVWKEEEPMEYLVLLKNPSRIMNFRSSELRFHLDWVGDKWIQPQKQKDNADKKQQIIQMLNKMSSKGVEKRGMQMEAETSSEKRKRGTNVKILLKGKECGGSDGGVDKIDVEDSSTIATVDNMSYENQDLLSLESSPVLRGKECGGSDGGVDKIIIENSSTIVIGVSLLDNPWAATVDTMPYENQNLQSLESSPVLRGKECSGAEGVVDKIIVEDSSTTGKECGGSEGGVDKIIIENSSTIGAATVDNMPYENQNLLSSESSPVLRGKECSGAEGGFDKIIIEDSSTTGATTVDNMPYENQNLQLLKSSPIPRGKECGRAEGIVDKIIIEDSSTTGAATVNNMSYENQILRSLESSPILRFVQSLEEFQLMPQKPHFRPLDECEEVYREGLALKHMMTFVNVVKKTSKLQVNASRSIMDSLLKCLPELESHGFNVTNVRRRLLELQTMEECREDLQTELEKVKCEIKMRTHEGTKINAELIDATKEIKLLEEKKARLVSMNEENDSEIAKLKSSDSLLNEHIQNVEHNFGSLATFPWR
ncbi:hypothetical protein EZV62_004185 [Acer yangbiense]|uniref:Agenet domain-containing protein n=1 Tax=Acer yangbiense TaxID=1000413 RepID=A0A5C7IJ00_9ROSI|nr:hypothetical protein EZV62_004185 [Acer yangbiense]